MFLKFPASVSQYETSPRADPSLSPSTATETIATKNTSASSAASVSNSVSMGSSPLSVTSSSTSSPESSPAPSSASTSPSSLPSSSASSSTSILASSSTSTSSSTSSAAPSPMTTGLIQEVCSLCSVTAGKVPNFSCRCGGILIDGDLNNYVWNDQGVLKAGHRSVSFLTQSIDWLLAACKGAPPTGANKVLPLQHLDLGKYKNPTEVNQSNNCRTNHSSDI
ncbi:hypothetical protein IF2G_11096 [Cordyceps javanica]|nr:hypothetical protein IF2G_11096 [Cordyceps javanica]